MISHSRTVEGRNPAVSILIHARIPTALLFLGVVLTAVCGCARYPRMESIVSILTSETPSIIVDDDLPLSPQERQMELDRLISAAGVPAILENHMRVVEAITGNPLIAGNKVTLLRDGPQTLDAIRQAVRNAKHHVHLETFIIRDDEVGRPLADLLLEKQAQGVQVRMIYDSIGSIKTNRRLFKRMRAGGISLYEFNPVSLLDVAGRWTLNNRNHRKILVVDGRIAFIGGLNFYDVYAKSPLFSGPSGGTDAKCYFRDTHVQIEGPVVAEFQKLFLGMWLTRFPQTAIGPDFFPQLEKKGDMLVQMVCSVPGQRVPNIYAAYMSAILHAEKSIHISQAYFIPHKDMLRALSQAVNKGVDVKIILPGASDFWMPKYGGRSLYSELLQSGVRLFHIQGGLLHAKTAVIDSVWSTVGSSNLDNRSFLHDAEANAVILDVDFADEMEQMFQDDLNQSEEIILEKWKRRGMKDRFLERLARVFRYWL